MGHPREGLAYEDGRRLLEGLDARGRPRPPPRRRRGARHLREPGRRRDLLGALDARRRAGKRGLGRPGEPAAGASRHLRHRACIPHDPSASGRSCRASACSETTDGGNDWTPRNRGLRADWPREHDEVGFCVHKLARADDSGCSSRTTSACTAPTTAARSWTEITEGLPTEFGFAAAVNPHDRDTFLVIPLDPGHGRTMPDGQAAGLAHARRGLELAARRTRGFRSTDALPGRARARADERHRTTCRATTSAPAPARSSRAPTTVGAGRRSRAICRRSRPSQVAT